MAQRNCSCGGTLIQRQRKGSLSCERCRRVHTRRGAPLSRNGEHLYDIGGPRLFQVFELSRLAELGLLFGSLIAITLGPVSCSD